MADSSWREKIELSILVSSAITQDQVYVLLNLHQEGKNILTYSNDTNPITSCLVSAAKYGKHEICRFYLETFPMMDREMLHEAYFAAILSDNMPLCSLFLKFGVQLNCYSAKHNSYAIHFAAANGKVASLKLFFEKGAFIDNCSHLDRTLLVEATIHGQHQAVKFLLQRGANPEQTDLNNNKAYQIGCYSCYAEKGYYCKQLGKGNNIVDLLVFLELDNPLDKILKYSDILSDSGTVRLHPIDMLRILLNAAYYSSNGWYVSKLLKSLLEAYSAHGIQDCIYALLQETLTDQTYVILAILESFTCYRRSSYRQLLYLRRYLA